MAIRAWLIERWVQTVRNGTTYNEPASLGLVSAWEDIAGTLAINIPPGINVVAARVDNIPNKAALDALDATPGVIVLSAINDDGTAVAGYLRPQGAPSGAQLTAARTRLQDAGIPTGWLTANITAGMTLGQVADVLRSYARDLRKDAQAAQAKQIG